MKSQIVLKEIIPKPQRLAAPAKNLLSPPVRCNDRTVRVGFNSTMLQ